MANWYAKKLESSVTSTGPPVVAFRRYRGRYSGQIRLGPVTTHLPSGYPTMTVTVVLENAGGALTRVPSDFPVLRPDMDPDPANPAALEQSYQLGPRTNPSQIVAHYRRLLGSAVVNPGVAHGNYDVYFEHFRGLSGIVSANAVSARLHLSSSSK